MGNLPKRVSDALSVVQGQTPDLIAPAQGSARCAVALAQGRWPPRPRSDRNLSQAYSAAVAKVSAGDTGGVGEIRKLADGGYAPAQFYLAELNPGRQGRP